MPPLPLASVLLRSLPWLSARGRAAVNFLVSENGRVSSAQSLASRLGLRNRYQLARLLRSEGLPPYDVLTGWVSLLYWRLEAERTNATLVTLAHRSRVAPATSYRLVRRITGARWSDLRRVSTAEVLDRFIKECGRPRARPRPLWRPPASTRGERASPGGRSSPPVRLALPGAPFCVAAVGPREVYVTRALGAAIERLDIGARRFVGTIPAGCVPTCVTIDATRGRAYATLQYEDAVAVIGTASHVVTSTFPVPGDPFPVLLGRNGDRLYVTTNEDRLHALCLPTGRVVGSLPLPATSHFLTLHPAGHRLYVATRSGGTVLEIDTARIAVTRTFVLGGQPVDLRVTADGRFLYVVNARQGLHVVRLADGRLLRTIKIEGRPVHLAVSPDERTLYISLVEAGSVAVVDRATLNVSFLPVGGRPRGMVLGEHGRLLVVANEAGWVDLMPV